MNNEEQNQEVVLDEKQQASIEREKEFRQIRDLLLAAKDLTQRSNILKIQIEALGRKYELDLTVAYDYPYMMVNTSNLRLRVTINLVNFNDEDGNAYCYDVILHFDDGYSNYRTAKYNFLNDLDKLLGGSNI